MNNLSKKNNTRFVIDGKEVDPPLEGQRNIIIPAISSGEEVQVSELAFTSDAMQIILSHISSKGSCNNGRTI